MKVIFIQFVCYFDPTFSNNVFTYCLVELFTFNLLRETKGSSFARLLQISPLCPDCVSGNFSALSLCYESFADVFARRFKTMSYFDVSGRGVE